MEKTLFGWSVDMDIRILSIPYIYISNRAYSYSYRILKLFQKRTSVTKLDKIFSIVIKYLYTVVTIIYNICIIRRIHRNLNWIFKLSIPCSRCSKAHQKVSVFVEFLYSIVPRVSY